MAVIVAGLDWGTNTSVLVNADKASASAAAGAKDSKKEKEETFEHGAIGNRSQVLGDTNTIERIFQTVVGVPKPTILPGILPNGKNPHFGNDAIKYKAHLDLFWPVEGTVVDKEHARMFMQAVRDVLDPEQKNEVRVVIGSPANATPEDLSSIREGVSGIIDKIVIVPEPFLAAMGYRDETKLGKATYHDPVVNTLFVDIGAGTTDLCKVQGYYPTSEDLICLDIAGNHVDKMLFKLIQIRYPDVKLGQVTVTRLKEENSFIGDNRDKVEVKVPVHGKHKTIDITGPMREACESLVGPVVDAIEQMARRCDSEVVEEMLANITLTGGGSQIVGLDKHLQKTLKDRDYLSAKVTVVPDYKPLVARGALKMGLKLKDDQWTIPM